MRHYQDRVGIGFAATNDTLHLSIPDRLKLFPDNEAYLYVRGDGKLILCKEEPKKIGSRRSALWPKPSLPGSRNGQWTRAKIPGGHFGMMDTDHEVTPQGDLVITVPPASMRIPPRQHGAHSIDEQKPVRGKNGGKNGVALPVRTLIEWTAFGLPDDVIIEIPVEEAKRLVERYR